MPSNVDRAKQFLPFDALKGFKEALIEKERTITKKVILSEDELDKLSLIISSINKGDNIIVTYYKNNQYIDIEGMVSKIDCIYKFLIILKEKIYFKDILNIAIDI